MKILDKQRDSLQATSVSFSGFAVRDCVDGSKEYMCRVCSQVRKQTVWQTSRYFLRTHPTTKDHLQNVRSLQESEITHQRHEEESSREAADVRNLNVVDISYARPNLKRPRVDEYYYHEETTHNDPDFMFTAGQEGLANSRRYPVIQDPAFYLRQDVVDKFGLVADDIDITMSSVMAALGVKGEY